MERILDSQYSPVAHRLLVPAASLHLAGPRPLPRTGQPGGPEVKCVVTAPRGHAVGAASGRFLSVSGADGRPCLAGSWESEELRDSLAQCSVNSSCDHYDFEWEKDQNLCIDTGLPSQTTLWVCFLCRNSFAWAASASSPGRGSSSACFSW